MSLSPQTQAMMMPPAVPLHQAVAMVAAADDHCEAVLLEELNHRLFNSFQIVSSLIASLRRTGRDINGIACGLDEIGERLAALARMHRLLSFGFAGGRLETHCQSICSELVKAFAREDLMPRIRMADIRLSPNRRLRVALLVVELVMNALKHGPAVAAEEAITVDLSSIGDGELELAVHDNRRPTNVVSYRRPRIVDALAESLSGTAHITTQDGYLTRVKFPAE